MQSRSWGYLGGNLKICSNGPLRQFAFVGVPVFKRHASVSMPRLCVCARAYIRNVCGLGTDLSNDSRFSLPVSRWHGGCLSSKCACMRVCACVQPQVAPFLKQLLELATRFLWTKGKVMLVKQQEILHEAVTPAWDDGFLGHAGSRMDTHQGYS
mmetsp:Transcript_51753/g.92311  ORF Transcript_51753/g.92311 Transcript_51753/m.92311 type:complete len:154 (+) Transcript_51753:842-1303(+)